MAGTFAPRGRQINEDFIADSDATTLNVPPASVTCDFPNIYNYPYSIANFDQTSPVLQSLNANLASLAADDTKAQQVSDEALWFESVSMVFRENAFITVGTSHTDFNSNDLTIGTPHVVDCIRDQYLDANEKSSRRSPLPSIFIDSMHSTAEGPLAVFNLASHAIENTVGRLYNSRETENTVGRLNNSRTNNVHPNRTKQQSSLFSQLKQRSVLMPEQPITFLNLNVASAIQNVDDPEFFIPDCCSPSSKSGRQVCMTDNKVSESGWTIYLDHSTDLSARRRSILDLSRSDLEFMSRVSRSPRNKGAQHNAGKKASVEFEDSSIVSDASSAPAEQPFSYQDELSEHLTKVSAAEASTGCRMDDLRDDPIYTSEFSLASISDGLPSRGRKRRKRDIVAKASTTLLHETPGQVEDGKMDHHASEGSGDNLTLYHQSTNFQNDERGFVGDRLKMLQLLIPNSEKLAREDVLTVAIDYIKSLELKIYKMFESTKTQMVNHRDIGTIKDFAPAPALVIDGIETAAKESVLHEKGLCLMPVSLLGNAL